MRTLWRWLKYLLGGLVLLFLLVLGFFYAKWKWQSSNYMSQLGERALVLTVDGHSYRDLNKNGQLDTYEDNRQPLDARVEDVLSQMTIEEKAGSMFITMALMGEEGYYHESPWIGEPLTFLFPFNSEMVIGKNMNHFNIIQSPSAEAMATWNNNIQIMAERTRLGIPVTVASDPRHLASNNPGANINTPFYSHWVSPPGFGAIGDTVLMRQFGEAARHEYVATGIRLALSPMADLATEPRWGRINGTFSEDAHLSAQLTKAYIRGFQGDTLGPKSVACMVKHFSGGGPQKDGEDAHFPYGKDQIYPGDNFDYHLIPFIEGAFPAKAAQVMPYYGVPVGQTSEDVGFGYNKDIITGLLRDSLGFDGVVCTDWGLITENSFKPPAAFGVESLSELERTAKILDAGCDMFGGEICVEYVVELVKSGRISEERINTSVRRILRDKFRLGLFDNPFTRLGDLWMVGHEDLVAQGRVAQQRALTLLKNDNQLLPLAEGIKVYVMDFSPEALSSYATVVDDPQQADVILQKLATPYEPRDEYFLEAYFRQGRLHFTPEELGPILALANTKPTITIITLERPAVIPEIAAASQALIADFDSQDDVIAELLFGKFAPTGRLPFELPSSIIAVEEQKEDVPYDSENPLYEFGAGLSYD